MSLRKILVVLLVAMLTMSVCVTMGGCEKEPERFKPKLAVYYGNQLVNDPYNTEGRKELRIKYDGKEHEFFVKAMHNGKEIEGLKPNNPSFSYRYYEDDTMQSISVLIPSSKPPKEKGFYILSASFDPEGIFYSTSTSFSFYIE